MTTLVAPILGPIVGGVICDQAHWSWIFYINVPIALACAYFAWGLLKRYEEPLAKAPIDGVGLGLLVIWVGALQIMLDEGKDLDWFSSPIIVGLALTAADRIQAALGLPSRSFTYLRSHGTLDQQHTQHLAELLERMSPSDQADVVHAARVCYKLYGDIFHALSHLETSAHQGQSVVPQEVIA